MISLRQLTYFAATAQAGSATRAAELLNVSQPSISAAIRDLEADLGQRLFHRRQARGLELTEFGAKKLREARDILARAGGFAASTETTGTTRIVMGYFKTLGPSWVPGALNQLGRELPGLQVELRECNLEEVSRFLDKGIIDVAITYDVGLSGAMARDVLAEILPHAVVASDHPLADQPDVTLAELARYPFILVDLPLSREFLMVPFWQLGLSPTIVLRTESVEMVRSMVANSLGVSLLFTQSSHDLSQDGKRVVCKQVRDQTIGQRLVIAYDATRTTDLVITSAIDSIRAYARRLAVPYR